MLSDGMFYAYIGALVVSALVLAFLAVRSSGTAYRIVQALLAAGFLGYAGYLLIANPPTVTVFFYAFALPILAVIRAVRFGPRRRSAPPPAPLPYAAQPAPAQPGQPAQPTGFPPPPDFSTQPAVAPPPGAPQQAGVPQHAGMPVPTGLPQPPGTAPQAGLPHSPGIPVQGGFPAGQPVSPAGPASHAATGTVSLAPAGPVSPAPGGSVSPAPGGPVSSAPGGFGSAAALFAPPPQPAGPAAPTVDPGSYRAGPSGLAGHHGPDHALPSGRPSGLRGSGVEAPPPVAPADPSTRRSGLPPRRVPTHAELGFAPSAQPVEHLPEPAAEQPPAPDAEQPPAHIESTQQMALPQSAPQQDMPAGPQPLYPQYPAPHGSSATAQHGRPRAGQHSRSTAEQAPSHAYPEPGHVPHGYYGQHSAYDQQGRHGVREQPVEQAGYDAPGWEQETAAYPQPGYRPAHGELNASGNGDDSATYPQGRGRHEQPEAHPADWPPLRQ